MTPAHTALKRLLIKLEELEVRLVFRLNREVDAFLHAPVQDLVVDRQVNLLILNNLPDLGDGLVALFKVNIGTKRLDHSVDIGVGKAGTVPGTTLIRGRMDQEVEHVF